MDYEKKYKDAVSAIKFLLYKSDRGNLTADKYREELESIIHELKENEDESIRIEIIDFATKANNGVTSILANNYNFNKWIAWLEKQAKNHTIEIKSAEESLGVDSDTYNKIVDECIYGEQKSADKVEPKFKVGDWVVYTGYLLKDSGKEIYVMQVASVEDDRYNFTDTSTLCFDSEKDMRSWTIQDAKDGDVLSYRDGQWCFIYKEIVTEDTFKYYALLSEKGITVNDAAFSLLLPCITPATKEQRDLLFQKMKEAGYEWDADKKELKKIKQNPAWSEEDEKKRKRIMHRLSLDGTISNNELADINDWLKDRVQPQNLTVTDEELAQANKDAYNEVLDRIEYHGGEPSFEDGWSAAIRYLKNRNTISQFTWKPSDEQMKALEMAINEQKEEYGFTSLDSLYEQLKAL